MAVDITDTESAQLLFKVAMFVFVQALVYVILSNSSDIFSNNKMTRSLSFKPPRSLSIRRILASVSDVPFEPSPSSTDESYQYPETTDDDI